MDRHWIDKDEAIITMTLTIMTEMDNNNNVDNNEELNKGQVRGKNQDQSLSVTPCGCLSVGLSVKSRQKQSKNVQGTDILARQKRISLVSKLVTSGLN